MKPLRPEEKIQTAIREKLHKLEWYTVKIHGSVYQSGLPDLYATHAKYGSRWIEVKNPKGFHFTAAQLEVFPKLVAFGTNVWVLISDDDSEIAKLFKPSNWYQYIYAGRQ
jgi:hypothetical protein